MCGSLADKDTSAYSNSRITRTYEVCVFTRIHGSQMAYRACVCVSRISLPRKKSLLTPKSTFTYPYTTLSPTWDFPVTRSGLTTTD